MPETAPADERHTVSSFCPLDCPDACSLEVEVADGRVVAVEGDHRNPVTAGFICTKVRHLPEHLYGPDRLLSPAVREGPKGEGRFRPISWAEAIERIATRWRQIVDEKGGEAILPVAYGGSNGLFTDGALDARLFARLGASRLAKTVCAAATGRAAEGLYGKMPGVAYPDYEKARLIVVWGANPSASSIHLVPYVRRAQEAGAQLVVVDPRRIPLAAKADLHLPVQPGGDLALALGVLRWLYANGESDERFLADHARNADALRERCQRWTLDRAAEASGLPAADIERFAALYAEASPAVIRCGWGPERNRNGGSAIAAILALPAVAGKFGVRAGGYTMSNSGAWDLGTEGAVAADEPPTRTINMNRLGRALTGADDPSIDALFVYNANPLATLPDQERVRAGLEREDLYTVVFDAVMTDTARYADLVLPATAFLEHAEMQRGYGSFVLQRADAVARPAGEARSNHEVFGDLLETLDLAREDDPEDLDDFAAAALASQGLSEELQEELAAQGLVELPGNPRPIQFRDVFPRTADRKVDLCPAELDAEAPQGLYGFRPDPAESRYPLALISPATRHTISSTFGQVRPRPARLSMHPEDAAVRGLRDGDAVRIFNELGEARARLDVSDAMRPGVVFLPKGLWERSFETAATANALCPDDLTDLGAGACFNDARVEVEAAS